MAIKAKIFNQNLFDFVITHYGSLEFLSLFLAENDIEDITAFGIDEVGTKYNVTPQSNRVLNDYASRAYQISTGDDPPTGDFNNDYNDDFFVS